VLAELVLVLVLYAGGAGFEELVELVLVLILYAGGAGFEELVELVLVLLKLLLELLTVLTGAVGYE